MVNLSYRQLLPRALTRRSSSYQKDLVSIEEKWRGTSFKEASSRRTPPSLPVELLIKIFEYLAVVDLLRCRSVCMQFKNIVDNSVETQYMIELYAAGCVDNPLCTNEATKARLSALRKEAQFWRDPKGTWQRTDFAWSVTYEDMRNTNWDDNLWIRFKKTFSAEEGKWNALQCVLFQPLEGGIPIAERWELSFPFSFVCVTGNPSESMVVLLDVETDSTSLKENYVISKVAVRDGTVLSRDTIPFKCNLSSLDVDWAEPEISVKGNGVAITRITRPGVANAYAHITILDLDTCANAHTVTRSIASSCLVATQHVDDKTVLLHMMKFGGYGIEVYAVVTVEPQICPTLSCLAPFVNSMTKLWHAATVELPAVRLNLVTPNNGFITGTSGGGLMPSVTTPERAFLRSVANPLIFLIRYYHNRANEITRTTHVFPLSFIQSLVKDFRDTICHQEVAWNRWGPQNSRCFVDHSSVITGAYGSQILLSDGSMLDFNPQLISHELMRVGKSPLFKPRKRLLLGRSYKRDVELPEGGRIVRQPTVFRKGPVFEQDVVTCLPYRETRLEGVPSTSALVFGGEVWVACTAEVDDDGFTRHNCYTLSP